MGIKIRKVVTVHCDTVALTMESILKAYTTVFKQLGPRQWVIRDFGLLNELVACYQDGLVTVADDPNE